MQRIQLKCMDFTFNHFFLFWQLLIIFDYFWQCWFSAISSYFRSSLQWLAYFILIFVGFALFYSFLLYFFAIRGNCRSCYSFLAWLSVIWSNFQLKIELFPSTDVPRPRESHVSLFIRLYKHESLLFESDNFPDNSWIFTV